MLTIQRPRSCLQSPQATKTRSLEWHLRKYNWDKYTNTIVILLQIQLCLSYKNILVEANSVTKVLFTVSKSHKNQATQVPLQQIQLQKLYKYDYEHYTNTTVRVIQMLLVDGLVYSFPKPQKLGHSSGSFSDDDHSHNIMRLTLRYE